MKNLTHDNLKKKKNHSSRFSMLMCREVQSKAQNFIYPYLLMIGKNLFTYASLMSIHALMPNLHKKCCNIDCRHQTDKAGKKYTRRYERLATMKARSTQKYPKNDHTASVMQKKNEQI